MSDPQGILAFDSALSADAKRELQALGTADILIGIPSHRNARTIEQVLEAVSECVRTHYRSQRVVLMNTDGGSSDNTVKLVEDAGVPSNVRKLLTAYEGTTGKGTGTRSIFEAAQALNARACLVLEARAPGIAPEWIKALVDPVLTGDHMTIPCFQRSGYAAALGDNLFYPFMRMFLNTNLRQPLMSEFCVSGAFAADLAATDVWETDVARFGINVWVAIQALTQSLRVSQVDLGSRGDDSSDPGTALDARFLHSVGSLFRLLTVHSRQWQEGLPRRVDFVGPRCPDRVLPCEDCRDVLVQALRDGEERYGHLWGAILHADTHRRVLEALSQDVEAFSFPLDLWRDLVLEFAVVFNQGEGDPDKVVEALLPLFYGRAASYTRKIEGLSVLEREAEVERIVQAFVEGRPKFEEQWDTYRSWDEDTPIYWLT